MAAIAHTRDVDTVTAEEWHQATKDERRDFLDRERAKGQGSYVCLRCVFPLAHGWDTCPVCALALKEYA